VILDAPYFGNYFEKIMEILIGHIRICRYKIFYFNMLICEKCGKYPGDQYLDHRPACPRRSVLFS